MVTTVQVKLYEFDELSESAKERARQWWRECENAEGMDTAFMYEDFQRVAEILGVRFDNHDVPLMNGSTRQEPKIWWSGFCSQGDGACFEGYYYYTKGAAKRIRQYAAEDKTLHQIADDLQAIQRPAFYRLAARIDHSGRYYHAYSMSICVECDGDRWPTEAEESAVSEAMRDFANWMYRQLEAEYEWRMSDENVDDSIQANEYMFEEDGTLSRY